MATHSIAEIAELVRNGMPPSDVAGLVLKAVRDNELYIFTHADMLAPLEARLSQARSRTKGNALTGKV